MSEAPATPKNWQQALLLLREGRSLQFTEIAARLGASDKSVRRWYQHAKGTGGTAPLPTFERALVDLSRRV